MIGRDWMASRPMRAALTALAVAVLLAGFTLFRAVRLDTVPEAAPPALPNFSALSVHDTVTPADIQSTVAHDLFAQNRRAPAVGYRLPSEVDDATQDKRTVQLPVVLGTAVTAGGKSFAMCQIAGGRAEIVHVGDRVGDYTVKSIERRLVVFTATDGKDLAIHALNSVGS